MAEVTIYGKNNLSGTITKAFEILKKSFADTEDAIEINSKNGSTIIKTYTRSGVELAENDLTVVYSGLNGA